MNCLFETGHEWWIANKNIRAERESTTWVQFREPRLYPIYTLNNEEAPKDKLIIYRPIKDVAFFNGNFLRIQVDISIVSTGTKQDLFYTLVYVAEVTIKILFKFQNECGVGCRVSNGLKTLGSWVRFFCGFIVGPQVWDCVMSFSFILFKCFGSGLCSSSSKR